MSTQSAPVLCYHRQAYGLPSVKLPTLSNLSLTEHVRQRAAERGIPPSLLSAFDPTTYPVFQVEMEGEKLIRLNYRKRMNSHQDYCAVVNPSEMRVISAWVQVRTFAPSINRAAYARPAKAG